jgi:hypothetical protein
MSLSVHFNGGQTDLILCSVTINGSHGNIGPVQVINKMSPYQLRCISSCWLQTSLVSAAAGINALKSMWISTRIQCNRQPRNNLCRGIPWRKLEESRQPPSSPSSTVGCETLHPGIQWQPRPSEDAGSAVVVHHRNGIRVRVAGGLAKQARGGGGTIEGACAVFSKMVAFQLVAAEELSRSGWNCVVEGFQPNIVLHWLLECRTKLSLVAYDVALIMTVS